MLSASGFAMMKFGMFLWFDRRKTFSDSRVVDGSLAIS
jgi:hypothetical protein